MKRSVLRLGSVALVTLLLGVATTAGVFALIPDPGSPPSIYDDFSYNSTASGFWHVNVNGSSATIKHSMLTLRGHSIELDHRMQTDPKETVVSVRVRGVHLHKFGIGVGIYHSGTVGMELDDDGIKCGRGTDGGWRVDFLKDWKTPQENAWFYLRMSVLNPYPDPKVLAKLGDKDYSQLKKVTLRCSAWDANGRLVATVNAKDPPPNAHYAALDEAFLRTWDSRNDYQIDWFYAGPPSGDPTRIMSMHK